SFLIFKMFPPLEMNSKLLCHAKTDVAADRRVERTAGMRDVPICRYPCMQTRPQAHVSCDAGQQRSSTAPILINAVDAVVLRMQQRQRRADKPFALSVLRLVWTVGEP